MKADLNAKPLISEQFHVILHALQNIHKCLYQLNDPLRLAASLAAMWVPVYERNADNMEAVLDEMIRLLQDMRAGMKDNDAVRSWFETSNTIHTAYQQLKQQQVHPLKNTLI